jgi:hypothetical protein
MAPAALLEDRIAPSSGGQHAAAKAPAAQVATFPMNIADTIAAGQPVSEQITTRFSNGSVQTETDQINPDNTNNTVDTVKTITLPNNGGTQQVIDFSYVALTGNTVHVITTTFPDGSIQTENKTLQAEGSTTLFQGTIKLPNGTIEAISGSTVVRGAVTTTDQVTQAPGGVTIHDHTVTVSHGELKQTTTNTETGNGRPTVTRSTVTIVRLQPGSSGLGNLKPGVTPSTPKLAGS